MLLDKIEYSLNAILLLKSTMNPPKCWDHILNNPYFFGSIIPILLKHFEPDKLRVGLRPGLYYMI